MEGEKLNLPMAWLAELEDQPALVADAEGRAMVLSDQAIGGGWTPTSCVTCSTLPSQHGCGHWPSLRMWRDYRPGILACPAV